MKKHLLGLLVLCLFICSPVRAGNWAIDGSDVPLRGIAEEDPELVVRSIRMPSINASQDGSELTINFQTTVRTVEFTVTNLSTGEVVYTTTELTPGTVYIDLAGEDAGEYLLEMRMPYWYFSGTFTLE